MFPHTRSQVDPDFLSDLRSRLRRVNALAPITTTQRAQVPLDDLLGLRGFELESVEGVVSLRVLRGGEGAVSWCLSFLASVCVGGGAGGLHGVHLESVEGVVRQV